MFTKFMGKDEISIRFNFNDKGFLDNIKLEIMDEGFFQKFDKKDKHLLDRLVSMLFHTISNALISPKPQKNQQNRQLNFQKVIETKICPRCKTEMSIDKNCCQNLKQQGFAAALKCSKCSYKVALKPEQLKQIDAN